MSSMIEQVGRWAHAATRWLAPAAVLAGFLACDATAPTLTGPSPDTSRTVVRMIVLPESVSLHPGDTALFRAWGQTAGGDSVAVESQWTAEGGSIGADGAFVAGPTTGTYRIVSRLAGDSLADTAQATVNDPPPAPVATVQVLPASTTLAPGEVAQFRAVVKDSAGNELSVRDVEWSSSDPGIAGVTADGLVTASARGISTITALSEGQIGTASVEVKPASVATVTVTPSPGRVFEGGTLQLQATARDAAGHLISDRRVTWTSTDSLVAGVSSSGLVSGIRSGTTSIVASSEGKSDTATITTVERPVASVSVSPDRATLAPSETVALTATLTDSAGTELSGRAISWTSDNPAVATVTSRGLVTALAAGSASVSAASEGRTGSATITVTTPMSGPCSKPAPAWVWCDDFNQDRSDHYFEYNDQNGGFVLVPGVGRNSTGGMRARFAVGQEEAGSLHLAFGKTPSPYFRAVDSGTAAFREIYWRVYIKHQPGWIGGGGYKLSRAMIIASPTWAQAMIAHVWGEGLPLVLDPASGTDSAGALVTTKYNDWTNLRWLGATPGLTPIFDALHVGRWYCIETRVRLNDAGAANGIFQLWVDGVLEASRADLNWVGRYDGFGLNAVYLENYWNGGSPQAQERYLDDFVVSTERIGC